LKNTTCSKPVLDSAALIAIMSEDASRKLQDAVERMLENMERRDLRPLQQRTYSCMAKCYEDKRSPARQVSSCAEQCSMPAQRANEAIGQEMQEFQGRLQRCAMQCQDDAKERLPPGADPSDARFEAAKQQLESCTVRCIDKHIKQLPNIEARIQAVLNAIPPR
ncbi:unnamed protein product, partial [Phaeothamnion confervicola]